MGGLAGDFQGQHGSVQDQPLVDSGGQSGQEPPGLARSHGERSLAAHLGQVRHRGFLDGGVELLPEQTDELCISAPLHQGLKALLAPNREGGPAETRLMTQALGKKGLVHARCVEYGAAGARRVGREGSDLACRVLLWGTRSTEDGEPSRGGGRGVLRRHLLFLRGILWRYRRNPAVGQVVKPAEPRRASCMGGAPKSCCRSPSWPRARSAAARRSESSASW